jgi:uncharacterized protein YndB with AHSA1/START domain
MSTTTSDRIEKEILLRAPRAKVWRALTDAEQFGAWFGCKLEGPFAVGHTTVGHITSKGHENLRVALAIERMDAEELFALRWHPYAIDPKVDYSSEPTTLVEFRLQTVPEGTLLTAVESGFDAIPAARRSEAFHMNSQGWAIQMENIARYVSR